MSLSEKSLLEFNRLHQEEFGETLNQDDLERKARMVRNLYIAIYRSPVEAIKAVEERLSEELPI